MKILKMLPTVLLLGMSLLLTSCPDKNKVNIEIPGVKGPFVGFVDDALTVDMNFEALELEGEIYFPIPKYDNSFLTLATAPTGGVDLKISVKLEDIFNGEARTLDPQKLPGGRNLPGVPGGSLPAIAFTVEQFNNMSFYIGPKVYGIFVPFKVGAAGAIATFRYYIGETTAGTISVVGEDNNGENAGVLLLLDLSKENEAKLRKLAELHGIKADY